MTRPAYSIIDFYDLESPYVTEYRRLLHRILNREDEPELKSLMVTSAMTGEGKSTLCSFLAITAAMKKGLKVLVIDADLRLPSIHKLFAVDSSPGLVEILEDGLNYKNAVRKTKVPGLDILTSGRRTEGPTEIFNAEEIGSLIDEMKFYYDLILVDCAPLLPVSDPMLLASRVDTTLLVVKAGTTQRELVQRALGILDPKRNNVLGAVLNNMNHSLPYYFDYDYYNYDYRQPSHRKTETAGEEEPKKLNDKSTSEDQTLKGNISQ